jgi:hypothetical protein
MYIVLFDARCFNFAVVSPAALGGMLGVSIAPININLSA